MAGLNWYLISTCLIVSCGGYAYGFGFASFITSQGQPTFYTYFDLDPTSAYTANILGACNALFNFGLAMGSLMQGWLCDKIGRKKAFAVAGWSSLIGSALITGAVVIEMLITVRVLHGFGLGMLICLVPLYLTEVAPPSRRGLLSGLTTFSFAMGYVVCAWMAVGTFHGTTYNIQVRLPLAFAMLGPAALLVGLPFIPESPRYLVLNNQASDAWQVLRRIHRDPDDPEDEAAHAEYVQIVCQTEKDKEIKASYIEMFRNRSLRKRTLLAMFIQFAAQSTGILGIANYLILIFTSLGMTGVLPLVLYGVYSTIGTTCVAIAIATVDKVGRRLMFLIGFPALALILIIEGVLQSQYLGTDNHAGLAACVLLVFVYIVLFQTVDGPAFIWMAEIFPTNLRGRGIGLGFFSYFVGAITYSTPSPLAFKNITYRMYFIYAGLCIISTIIVYIYIPETKQIPVEEIGALFGDEIVVHLTANGHGIVEQDKAKNVLEEREIVEMESVQQNKQAAAV